MSAKWKWCLEDDNKKLLTGWQRIGDYWYYLNVNGAMATGWLKDTDSKWYYLDESTGRMQTGWKQINNKWYYLNNNGSMAVNTITPDGYKIDINGVWQDSLLSDSGAEFIGSWEGFWSQAQYDPYYPNDKRYITIGYGTTFEAMPSAFNSSNPLDSTCTKEQAIKWLKDEAKNCAETIKAALDSAGITLNQNELDACISFAYNCGTGALLDSTFWKNVIGGVRDSDTITANLQAWSKANGVTSAGLFKRRLSEAALFLNGDYTGNN
jgi:lysozyme